MDEILKIDPIIWIIIITKFVTILGFAIAMVVSARREAREMRELMIEHSIRSRLRKVSEYEIEEELRRL